MSRRTAAGLLALGLIAALSLTAARMPSHYVTFRPGPTMNVLGKYDGKQIIKVSGHEVYADAGALRMTTVYPSGPDRNVSVAAVLTGWLDPDTAVLPRDVVYQQGETQESVRQESAAEMTSSQDAATAAAMTALGEPFTTHMKVTTVSKDGPAQGLLEAGDVFVTVGGVKTPDAETLLAQIRPKPPGTELPMVVERKGKRTEVTVTTEAAPDNPKESRVGVGIQQVFDFPIDVKIQLPSTVGGPSAGSMFALGIYDVLTPGSLTDGKPIAGTGTITATGKVGPIGGIAQKIAGAERDGAKLFLAPAGNCAEAARAHYDHDKLRVVRVDDLKDAIDDIEAWAKNPRADLPRCR